jgi:ribosomal protein L11 methyltransferase
MEYYEVTFKYDSPIETGIINDLLADELSCIGFDSFISEEDRLLAYILVSKYDKQSIDECIDNFPLPNVQFHYTPQRIAECNWNEEWEKNYFQPIRIEKECLIRASFHPDEKGFKHSIVIDPRMAFGTGNHATTYLMLCELLQLDVQGKVFLDMGCGTAVLAILAALKGASRIVAIDIDEWAYTNALENCLLNHSEQVEVVLGGAEQIVRFETFDFIFANITRNILLEDICRYASALKPEGLLFMSGFYREDIPAIKEACHQNGLLLISFTEQNNWVAVQTQKNDR